MSMQQLDKVAFVLFWSAVGLVIQSADGAAAGALRAGNLLLWQFSSGSPSIASGVGGMAPRAAMALRPTDMAFGMGRSDRDINRRHD